MRAALQPDVIITIERLVLDGFDLSAHDAQSLKQAVEAGLVELLTAEGLPQAWQSGGAVPSLYANAPATGLNPPSRPLPAPQSLGDQIARGVYSSLGVRDE
jgi:hypothetical protein